MPTTATRVGRARPVLAWSGVVLHVLVGVFPYSASGLVAPGWAIGMLYLGWTALLVLAVRSARPPRSSPLTVMIPGGALALWFTVISLGEALLDWTA